MTIDIPGWVSERVFYQIFPDRFARSERLSGQGMKWEEWGAPPSIFGFKGGDLFGILERLDYLEDLGINAIYLNPIFSSAANHRYHTYDYHNVDALLGGNQGFLELLKAAHGRKMRIMLDGVFNHASRGLWQFHHVLENGSGSPYRDWFHFNPNRLDRSRNWGAYPGPQEMQALESGAGSLEAIGYQAWWNMPALPKFRTETAAVREFLWRVAEYWCEQGIDGWRLDVPEEIADADFWREFRRRTRNVNPEVYLVGEIWHEARQWLAGDMFDAVMNYQLATALLGFLVKEGVDEDTLKVGGYQDAIHPLDAGGFSRQVEHLLNLYDPAVNQAQFNLLDSHDTPRFLTSARGDTSALRLAWMFLFTFPGVPCIYYGDEIGMQGRRDPDCRKAFPWDEKEWDSDLREHVKGLIALRRANPALRSGFFCSLHAADDVYAYARWQDQAVHVIVLNASQDSRNLEIPVSSLQVMDGRMVTLFGDGSGWVKNGIIHQLQLAPRSGIVLCGKRKIPPDPPPAVTRRKRRKE